MPTSARAYAALKSRVTGKPQVKRSGKIPHRKVFYDGYTFDSMVEGERYKELRLLEKAGQIKDLEVHPEYLFVVNEQRIGTYTADFRYWENGERPDLLYRVVEDVKSAFTRKNREYRRNRKLMEACHGITIREVVR